MSSITKTQLFRALLLILALGLLIRVVGINYGLPQPGYFSSDEIDNVARALKFSTGSLKPSHFNKPTCYNLLLFLEYGAAYVVLNVTGFIDSVEHYRALFFQNPTIFYLLARLTSALSGTLLLFFTFLIGRRLADERTALLAAVIACLAFVSVKFSHIAKADLLAALLCAASLYWLLLTLRRERWTDYLIAGLSVGLVLSTKYSCITILVPLALAQFLKVRQLPREREGSWWPVLTRMALLVAALLVGFSLGTPYFALHPLDFVQQSLSARILRETVGTEAILGLEAQHGPLFLLRCLIQEFGYLGMVLILSGLVAALFARSHENLLCLSLVVAHLALLLLTRHLDFQYLIPITPLVSVFAARLLLRQKLLSSPYLAALLLIVLLDPIARVVFYDRELLGGDTRQLAGQWIEQHIAHDNTLLIDSPYYFHYHPALPFSRQTYERLYQKQLARESDSLYYKYARKYVSEQGYDAEFLEIAFIVGREPPSVSSLKDLSFYRQQGFDYLIISSYFYERFFTYQGPGFESVKAFYGSLDEKTHLVKTFTPQRGVTAGPTLTLYSLKTPPN